MVGLLREYVQQVLLERLQPFNMEEFRHFIDYDDMFHYLSTHSEKIGKGAGRVVYDTKLGYVIKFSIDDSLKTGGVAQNKKEVSVSRCSQTAPVPRVYAYSPNFEWIAVEKVLPIFGKRLKQLIERLTGLKSFVSLQNAVSYSDLVVSRNRLYDYPQKTNHLRLYGKNDWYTSLVDLIKDCDLDVYELHSKNFGLTTKGKLVLLDPGV